MSQPTASESNSSEVLPTRNTDEPQPVAHPAPDSTTYLKLLAAFAFVYVTIAAAAGISTPKHTGYLAIFWVMSTLSSLAMVLLGMWSAQSPGGGYVRFFRYALQALYMIQLWIGLSKLDPSDSDSEFVFPNMAALAVGWFFFLAFIVFFGYGMDALYVSMTLDLGAQEEEAYKMSGPAPQNTGNSQTWFSRMVRQNQHQGLLGGKLSDSQEKLLLDNLDAV